MIKSNFRANANFLATALRQLGYTNYTAIADIVDNSLEPEVGSKNIFIDLIKDEKNKNTISDIVISDDGCGMSFETLCEAMELGSKNPKDCRYNLGLYGAGMKTASISIGKCLTVVSKEEDTDFVNFAMLDLDSINEEGSDIDIIFDRMESGTPAYKFFTKYTKSTHGTVVKISKLDRIQNKDYYGFEGTLIKKIRIYFNKFIGSNICNFFVNNKKLTYFDTIGNKSGFGTELMDEGEFTHNSSTVQWKAWYIPNGVEDVDFDNAFGRTNVECGIYIYRQQRLVGYGLDFGMTQKTSHWTNGFRFELFMDGTADDIFSTTFTKMITEKDKAGIEQSFYDKLKSIVSPLARQCANTQKRETDEKKVSEEIKNGLERNTERLNKNILLKPLVKEKGENKKRNETKPKNLDPKKQENPNPTKRREGKWFSGYEFFSDGETGIMYDITKKDGKAVVLINQDHAFYEKIFKELDEAGRSKIADFLACEFVAYQNCDYFTDEDTQKHIDNYKRWHSESVRRAFQ